MLWMPAITLSQEHRPETPQHSAVLASEVLMSLQRRDGSRPRRIARRVNGGRLAQLIEAVLSEAFESAETIQTLTQEGLTYAELADSYIPAAARQLGCDWVEDVLSFAKVTVGAGRLQEMLGRLGHQNDFVGEAHDVTPNVLVVSLEGDHHTIGWKLLTVQLRRLGAAAHAVLEVTPDEVAELIGQVQYDLVMISGSRPDTVDQIAAVTKCLRTQMIDMPPIVLGGIIIDHMGDAVLPAGVVAVTNCLETALSHKKRQACACHSSKK
jgi:methylmalonyl-CoA mutase cobalamin-binding subunit